MKKVFPLIPFALILPMLEEVSLETTSANAANKLYIRSDLPTTIVLKDYTRDEVRSYYSDLVGKDASQLNGDNLLKNLKPILSNNQKYYDYDAGNSIWQMYEITDRDWDLSPANEIVNGTYDPVTDTITNYVYGKSNSNYDEAANPYLKSYYMDYSKPNQVKAWGNHDQDGYGINREHLWAKSEGFDDDTSGSGARGDPMHLVAANGCVNREHNNNYYGYVDKTDSSTYDCKTKFYDSVGHNYVGPSKTHPTNGVKVFEPQDDDKGDIARAIFYMVARYNNLAGDDSTIGGANPNLALTNDLTTWKSKGYTSTADKCGYMGVLDDLLEWNELDPVDDYEIHRNNILCRNFTNNRNPFIDFPQWANIIWGNDDDIANPTTDPVYGGDPNTISNFEPANIQYGETVSVTASALSGDVQFKYSRNERGPFDSEIPSEAGIWYVQAKSEAIGDYRSDKVVKSFRIIGDPNTVSEFVVNDVKVGKEIMPSAKALVGDVKFTYSDKESGPFTDKMPTEPGTYYVKATSINSGKFESESKILDFRILHKTFIDEISDENGLVFGLLTPQVFYIVCIVAVVVILVMLFMIFVFGKKKTKKKTKKIIKNTAKDLGINIPKMPSTDSSAKKKTSGTKKSTSTKKTSTSSSTKKKSTSGSAKTNNK